MTDRRTSEEDNPFAPPPEGQPDQPWRPRYPQGPEDAQAPQGSPGSQGPESGGQQPDGRERDEQSSRWGSQWSGRQPGRQSRGFGEPPPTPEGRGGRNGDRDRNGGVGGGRRWDPTDPGQRHARYAVLAGMWGVFAGLLGWEWLGLLLGALSLYWGISALRGGPKTGDGGRDAARRSRLVAQLEGRAPEPPPSPAPPPGPATGTGTGPAAGSDRPQLAAAVAGIVLAAASLLIVATTYTVQFVYKDYYDCVDDALTAPSREACEDLLPSQIRPFLTEQN
jgi:hypothetical protein